MSNLDGRTILAIDPGPQESAYALVEVSTRRPLKIDKILSVDLRKLLGNPDFMSQVDEVSIELVESMGMPVGAEIFDTVLWVGRFIEVIGPHKVRLIGRRHIKLHHCFASTANDSNITKALVERFARGVPNFGKGTKANPGWFYGFSKDRWQAYALGVYAADVLFETGGFVGLRPAA